MNLGAFSVSLAVKNIQDSKKFYEALGFAVFHGDIDQKRLMMKNINTVIGLFEGMFKENIITFNPGRDNNGNNITEWDDVRIIQEHLKKHNITLTKEADTKTQGPEYITLVDPDGNQIMVDQHR